jgi:SAM-dependent methyltransferase
MLHLSAEACRLLVQAASTGEFMFPEHWALAGNIPTIASHLHHYATVAAQIGPRDSVLDVACGCGLAARLYRLRTTARVVAVDRPPAIDVARSLYYMPGIEYVALDFTRDALPEGRFTVAVLTEVYEHLHEAAGRALIRQIAARLRPHGRLYVSVPLLSRGERQAAKYYRHHVRDFEDEADVLGEIAGELLVGQSAHLVHMATITASEAGQRECASPS